MADSSSSLSPEKRLLNLIESGGKGGAVPPADGQTKGKDAKKTSAAPPKQPPRSFKERVESLLASAKQFFAEFRTRFGLKTINKTAQIALGFLTLLTLASVAYEIKTSGRDPLAGLDAPERKMTPISVDEPEFDTGILQSPESRNVFIPFSKREEIQAVKPSTESTRLVEMTKTLKLTGISYNPENIKAAYCMIEDLQKNMTSFLRLGDSISGMKVSKIKEESVELELGNEKIEIH